MDGSNHILALATRVFERRAPLDAVLRDDVPALLTRGIPWRDMIDAQLSAFQPACPSLLGSIVASICAEIGVHGAPAALPGGSSLPGAEDLLRPSAIHLAAADCFDDRSDRLSLQLAVQHYRTARRSLDPADDTYQGALIQEGDCRRRLAEHGVDPLYNLEQAIEMARQAGRHFGADPQKAGTAALNEGIAHDLLANLGVDPETHLQAAVGLQRRARALAAAGSDLVAKSQVNEAASCVYLAELGVQPIDALNAAVRLCEAARESFSAGSFGFGKTLLNEGNARRGLAAWKQEPVENLLVAVTMLHEAQGCFEPDAYDRRLAVAGEAGARRELAELGVDPILNLEAALTLQERLKGAHEPGTLPHTEQSIQEAKLRIGLARHGQQPQVHLKTAAEICREARRGFDPTGHTHAQACTSEGNARLSLAELGIDRAGNCRAALALFEESERPHEPGSADWAVARRNAARALWRLGRLPEAFERLESGLANLDVRRSRLLTERERIAFAESIAGQYQDAAAICLEAMEQERDEERRAEWRRRAWHQVHRAKNRALLELLQGGRPRLHSGEEEALWEELEDLDRRLDDRERLLVNRRLPPEDAAAHRREHARLLRLLRDLQERVLSTIEGAATFLNADVPPTSEVHEEMRRLAAQRGGDGQRTLLVELFLTDAGTVLAFLAPLWSVDALEVEEIRLPAGTAKRIAGDLFAATGGLDGRSSGRELESVIERMSALVEPWASRLDGWQPTEVVIASHSYLNLLPFQAAPVGGRPLFERLPVTHLPSPTLAASLRRKAGTDCTAALLIGDPLRDLPGAARETRRIADEVRAAGREVHCFLGDQATIDRVRDHAPLAAIVHFACHSRIDHAEFLRSGLKLSDDRWLTVLEVMATLDLESASLVYLNSCDSARPVIGRTEELMALARAFLYAGAPTVVASLWPVADEAGRRFAEHFYHAWLTADGGTRLNRSFQLAMRRTREEMPDPRDWAPFVMIGAW